MNKKRLSILIGSVVGFFISIFLLGQVDIFGFSPLSNNIGMNLAGGFIKFFIIIVLSALLLKLIFIILNIWEWLHEKN